MNATIKGSLADRAMICRVHISMWKGRKLDKQISQEVDDNYHAKDGGNYNKKLIDPKAIKPVQTVVSAAYEFFKKNSRPWLDSGWRILPSANYLQCMDGLREHKYAVEHEADIFVSKYIEQLQLERVRLNGMFRESDYPHPRDIARRFGFEITCLPLPEAKDFRVDIGDSEAGRIRDDIAAKYESMYAKSMEASWTELHKAVSHMADKLEGFDPSAKYADRGTFRDTLVTNLIEMCDRLPRLNITGDPTLDAATAEVRARLCQYDGGDLRKSDAVRETVAADAREILKKMSGYFGETTDLGEESEESDD